MLAGVTTAQLALVVAVVALAWAAWSWWHDHHIRVKVTYSTLTMDHPGGKTVLLMRASVVSRCGFPVTIKTLTFGPRGTRRKDLTRWIRDGRQVEAFGDLDLDYEASSFPEVSPDAAVAWVELPGRKFRGSRPR